MEWLLIFGMMLVTFVPRYLPFALVEKLELPPLLLRALPYVPIAVLSAIVAQNSFFLEGTLQLSLDNARLLSAIIAVVVAMISKSLWWTLGIGMLVFLLLQQLL